MALNDPTDVTSLSYRLRSKRDHFLREFLLRNDRSIIDLGGTSDYWRRVGLDFLKDNGFTFTIVNMEETELGEGPFKRMVGNACQIVEDARLVTGKQMRELFPDADFQRERFAGLTKSWIAMRG